MPGIKRSFAAFGFSLLFSDIVLLSVGIKNSYIAIVLLLIICFILTALHLPVCSYAFIFTAAFITAAVTLNAAISLYYKPSLLFTGMDLMISGQLKDFPLLCDSGAFRLVLKNCVINDRQTPYSIVIYINEEIFAQPMDSISLTVEELFNSSRQDRFYYHTLSGGEWLTGFSRGNISVTAYEKRHIVKTLLIFKKYIIENLQANMDFDASAVAAALLTGSKDNVSDAVVTNFSLSGISHIFAVSGMHLSLWSNLIFVILRKRSETKRIPLAAASVFVILYCIFTGLSPSVLRSAVMLLSVYIGAMIRQKADSLNSLGLSAAVLLAANPFLAGNVSFLLSFTSTFALVGFFPAVISDKKFSDNNFKNINKAFGDIKSNILISLCVLFTTLPFTAFFFGYCTMLSPFTSLVCTPLAEMLMISGAASVALSCAGFSAGLLYFLSEKLAKLLISISAFAAECDFAICSLNEFYILPWFIITSCILLYLHFIRKSSAQTLMKAFMTAAAAVLITAICHTGYTQKDIKLFIPDAGNCLNICVSANSGGFSMQLGCDGSYETLADIKRFFISDTASRLDFLVIPDAQSYNRKLCDYTVGRLSPAMILQSDALAKLNENSILTDSFDKLLCEGVHLSYEIKESFAAAALTLHDTRIIISLYPGSDFSNAESKWLSGDYLICREEIPESIDACAFENIIVLSDKGYSELSLPENAVSVKDAGDITIKIRRNKNADNK